jgi:hypothetical protein
MKHRSVLALALIPLWMVTAAAQAVPRARLIAKNSVGPVQLGMTVAQVRKALPQARLARTTEGDGIAMIEVKQGTAVEMVLYAGEADPEGPIAERARVEVIAVLGETYSTAEGAHPGMLLRDVEKIYGKLVKITLSASGRLVVQGRASGDRTRREVSSGPERDPGLCAVVGGPPDRGRRPVRSVKAPSSDEGTLSRDGASSSSDGVFYRAAELHCRATVASMGRRSFIVERRRLPWGDEASLSSDGVFHGVDGAPLSGDGVFHGVDGAPLPVDGAPLSSDGIALGRRFGAPYPESGARRFSRSCRRASCFRRNGSTRFRQSSGSSIIGQWPQPGSTCTSASK